MSCECVYINAQNDDAHFPPVCITPCSWWGGPVATESSGNDLPVWQLPEVLKLNIDIKKIKRMKMRDEGERSVEQRYSIDTRPDIR